MHIDLEALITSIGYIGLFIIIFTETGLLIGFFLPGDTLLITTGLLLQRGHFEWWILIPLLIVAAVLGDFTGYQIGARAGPRCLSHRQLNKRRAADGREHWRPCWSSAISRRRGSPQRIVGPSTVARLVAANATSSA